MRSRARAVLYAMGTGMAVGCGFVLTGIGMSWSGPYYEQFGGPAAGVIQAIPGTFLLGVLFTLPNALFLVLTLAAVMRRASWASHPILWGIVGTIAAAPAAWLFGAAFGEEFFEVPSAHTILLALGFVCGLMGRWGYRDVGNPQNFEENPSTTA
jgi:hypothetical protein